MSITFPRKFAIGGVPVTNIKEGLKSLSRTNDPGSFVGLRSVFPTLIHGSHALEIAGLLGLLDDERSDLTPTGRAVAHSRSVVKTDLTKARAILDQLLERFVAINADPDRLISINRVYLYGSVMRGDPLVGDIDLEIEASRGPAYAINTHQAQGDTRDMAIGEMHSSARHLSNQRLALVMMTRVRDDIIVVTNDRDRLLAQIGRNPGDKTSALETLGEKQVEAKRSGREAGEFRPTIPDHLRAPEDRQANASRIDPASLRATPQLDVPERNIERSR